MVKFQNHTRIGRRGDVQNIIMMFDEADDTGHYLRRSGHEGSLECPFGCPARALIEDEDAKEAEVTGIPAVNCEGNIANFRKFAFCSLAENGRLTSLPRWAHRLTLCEDDDPVALIIEQVAQVNFFCYF